LSLVRACSLLALAFCANTDDAALAEFLQEFSERRGDVQNVQAVFVQNEISPDDIVKSEGMLVYVSPRRILFRYADPAIVYLIDALRVYEYDAEFEQVQAFDLKNDPEAEALFLGFGGDPERLREAYDLSLSDAEPGACGTRVLTLTPRSPDTEDVPQEDLYDDAIASSLFIEARLTLSGDDMLPCRIEIINDSENRVIIDVLKYSVNEPIEPGADRLELPEGTRIIENEELTETVGPEGAVLPREPAETP
jgi:outer membrane lipoprotein-sorting protein